MSRLGLISCLACVFALTPGLGAGQTLQVQSIELAGGYFAFAGDDVDGLEAGPRGELTLLLDVGAPVDLGVTGSYGRGGLDGADSDYRELGFGATARRSFGSLYVGALAGWTQLKVTDLPGGLPDVETNGFNVGPSLGIVLPVGGLGITVAGEALWQSLGDFRVSGSVGPTLGGGGSKGWRYGVKAGVQFGG